MIRFLPRRAHGAIDYLYAAAVAAAPSVAGFRGDPTPTWLAYALALGVIAASLVTRYEWGVWRLLPYRLHLIGDAAFGLLALAAPFLFGFSSDSAARDTFLAAGAFSVLAAALSRPGEMAAGA